MPTPVSLQRDLNFVAVAGGVLDDGSGTIAPLSIQASTGRLKVTAIGISGSGVSKIIAGTGISVSPVGGTGNVTITASGGGSGYQAPLTGGLTGTNTWTTAPNSIVVDGVNMQKTRTDGTVNWTGTTTTVLTVAPSFDIYSNA
jgi:hypothetical protein